MSWNAKWHVHFPFRIHEAAFLKRNIAIQFTADLIAEFNSTLTRMPISRRRKFFDWSWLCIQCIKEWSEWFGSLWSHFSCMINLFWALKTGFGKGILSYASPVLPPQKHLPQASLEVRNSQRTNPCTSFNFNVIASEKNLPRSRLPEKCVLGKYKGKPSWDDDSLPAWIGWLSIAMMNRYHHGRINTRIEDLLNLQSSTSPAIVSWLIFNLKRDKGKAEEKFWRLWSAF